MAINRNKSIKESFLDGFMPVFSILLATVALLILLVIAVLIGLLFGKIHFFVGVFAAMMVVAGMVGVTNVLLKTKDLGSRAEKFFRL